jgi:pimeloyl-ACP methyl ester carboxylesterase
LVTEVPETRYARSADGTNLAYQISGDGPVELMFLHGGGIPIDSLSDDPGFVRLRRRLDTFGRTVWFDRRGWGASEGDPRDFLGGEIFDADLTALLDAVGFERPVLVAEGLAGVRAIPFSVIHPERVTALVLVNTHAHYVREDDYPWGVPPERLDRFVTAIRDTWGTAAALEVITPNGDRPPRRLIR